MGFRKLSTLFQSRPCIAEKSGIGCCRKELWSDLSSFLKKVNTVVPGLLRWKQKAACRSFCEGFYQKRQRWCARHVSQARLLQRENERGRERERCSRPGDSLERCARARIFPLYRDLRRGRSEQLLLLSSSSERSPCLNHMSHPLVAIVMPQHVADSDNWRVAGC